MNVENPNQRARSLYTTEEYIVKNPSLHKHDSLWKVSLIVPLIDVLATCYNLLDGREISILDVGGGAGVVLRETAFYVARTYSVRVNKLALDLSPGMLEIQKEYNPDLQKAVNEDICRTSLSAKVADLTLMIDVLEHVPDPIAALEELNRISRFVIFKVPLEDNLVLKIGNCLSGGRLRDRAIRDMGHINVYNFSRLKYDTEKYTGRVLYSDFANLSGYLRNSESYKSSMRLWDKLRHLAAASLFRVSPRVCASVFTDFAVILAQCDQHS